jgi:hypothetical protein
MSSERSWSDVPASRSLPTFSDRNPVMNKLSRRTATVTLAATAAVALGSGVAYAFWTTNGSGNATATAGSAAPVNAVAAPTLSTGLLYPGGNVPATINIANPNPFPVKVTRIVVAAASQPTTVDGTHQTAGCTAALSAVGITTGDTGVLAAGAQLPIPAGGSITTTVSGANITMGLASDNNCQGATFAFGTTTTPGPVVVTAQAG